MLVTNSSKYGLTKGSYKAEDIEVTPLGKRIYGSNTAEDKKKAQIEAAIQNIEPFKLLYDRIVGSKLPIKSVIVDMIKEHGVTFDAAEEAVDTFIVNLRDVGLLQLLSGAERVVSVDTVLGNLQSAPATQSTEGMQFDPATDVQAPGVAHPVITADHADFETTAFYISPIGSEDSDTRQHADLFASHIVEPALEQSKLKLIRADQIDSPGVITKQIIEYIIRSRLVIVDLSFHNPNVFYELAIRHMLRKPVVQIMRASDTIPFDIAQSRTIQIDDSNIYALVPKIGVHVASISAQVRQALDNPDAVDNPISIYFPALRATFEKA